MPQANQRLMMTETMMSVYCHCRLCQRVCSLNHAWKYWIVQKNDIYVTVPDWRSTDVERQLCDSSRLKEHRRWKCYLRYRQKQFDINSVSNCGRMELGLSRRLGLVLTSCLVQYLDDNIQLAVQGSRDIPCRYVQHVIVSCQNTVYLIKVVFSIPGDCLLVVEAIVNNNNNHFRSSNSRHIPDITEAFIYSVQT